MSKLAFSVTEKVRQLAYEEGFHAGYDQAMSEMQEIVKCENCKHGNESVLPDKNGKCMVCCSKLHCYFGADFSCADGERREQTDG